MNQELFSKACQQFQKEYGKTPTEANMQSIAVWNDFYVYAKTEEALNAFLKKQQTLQRFPIIFVILFVFIVIEGTLCLYEILNNSYATSSLSILIHISIVVSFVYFGINVYNLSKLNKAIKNQVTLLKINN